VIVKIRGNLSTETRLGNLIDNYFDRSDLVPGTLMRCESLKAQYPREDHRRGVPSTSYNCHGLSFASRRTGISDPTVVRSILQEDDYVKVDRARLLTGDTVIYVDDQGDIVHSGIVVEILQLGGAKVVSKWGDCHEVIHSLSECPYPNTVKEFYRVCK
jgi:hypothetical protein